MRYSSTEVIKIRYLIAFLPSFLHSDHYHFVTVYVNVCMQSDVPPLPLPNGDALDRALSVLDKTPCVDTHKIGVVYVRQGELTSTLNVILVYHSFLFV